MPRVLRLALISHDCIGYATDNGAFLFLNRGRHTTFPFSAFINKVVCLHELLRQEWQVFLILCAEVQTEHFFTVGLRLLRPWPWQFDTRLTHLLLVSLNVKVGKSARIVFDERMVLNLFHVEAVTLISLQALGEKESALD
jgi:hypothetical protein